MVNPDLLSNNNTSDIRDLTVSTTIFSNSFSVDRSWLWTRSTVEAIQETIEAEFSDAWGFQSLMSIPVTLIDIPEPKRVSVGFTYNFYTRNERTSGAGNFEVIDLNNMTPESEFISNADTYPRFNQISILPTEFNNVDAGLNAIHSSRGPNLIRDNLSAVQDEDAIATAYFSAIHMKDDFIDEQFYETLSTAASMFRLFTDTSGQQIASELCSVIDDRAAFNPDGLQIKESLSNIQLQGVSYAPTDTRSEISNKSFRDVTNLDFSINVNNKLVRNLTQSAIEDKSNIYENEVRSLIEKARQIQDAAVSSAIPGIINADEFQISIDRTLHEQVVTANSPALSAMNEHSLPIGFIVEKIEIAQRGENDFERIAHPPLIVENYGPTNLLDLNVRYGATYIYNVKTVTLTRFEAFRTDDTNNVQDQVIVATIVASSAGLPIKIDCTENIPPNPPRNLSFKWDYGNDNLMLFWEEESNPQRDVVRYQIFRRKTISVPFTLIQEFDFDASTSKVDPLENAPEKLVTKVSGPRKLYVDHGFSKNSNYIYTLAAIDARGLTSNYSSQFSVRFDSSRNKLHVELVSQFGAPKPYPNLYLNNDLFVDSMKDSGHNRMRVFFDPEFADVFTTEFVETHNPNMNVTSFERNTEFLNLIANNYKIQIINVDNQLSKVIDITVDDKSGPPLEVPVNPTTMTTFGFSNTN